MSGNADRTTTVIGAVIGVPLAIVLLIWTGWITFTAFFGGQAPLFFIEFDGFNLLRGLFWLVIIDPIVLTVAYWIFMLIMLPIAGLMAGALAIKNRKN
jgi:hypothetical protein